MGYLHVKKLPDFRFEHAKTARKYEIAAPAFSGLFQMERAIDYLSDVGFDRIGLMAHKTSCRSESPLMFVGD